MSEPKFTPGPWIATSRWSEALNCLCVRTKTATVAGAFYIGGMEQAHLNAALIAAAPDLYAALESLLDAYADLVGIVGYYLDELHEAKQARAALAKARGEL